MFPFAPAPARIRARGQPRNSQMRPRETMIAPALRVLYHDPSDTQYISSIQGHIVPANPISLPTAPPGVTGVFGAHVVAVDASTGSVIAGPLAAGVALSPDLYSLMEIINSRDWESVEATRYMPSRSMAPWRPPKSPTRW
jgi:hypothetical protein